jgi:hypothetical protein
MPNTMNIAYHILFYKPYGNRLERDIGSLKAMNLEKERECSLYN